jgi:predicted metal-dependent enzyme (double-stranded beta helix superfamily)
VPDDGAYSLVAAVWRPGQRTAVHDHVAWCVVGVHRGEEHETRYRLVPDDLRGDHLVEDGHTVGPCGEVTVRIPPGDIHAVVNDGPTPRPPCTCTGPTCAIAAPAFAAAIAYRSRRRQPV